MQTLHSFAFRPLRMLCGVLILTVAGMIMTPASTIVHTVTSTGDSGPGTLREAFEDINLASAADHVVEFNFFGTLARKIRPESPLPALETSGDILIDGGTHSGISGEPLIELDGSLAGTGAEASGITLHGGRLTIKKLIINRFAQDGIRVDYAPFYFPALYVYGCWIGTDSTGLGSAGNRNGIGINSFHIDWLSTDCIIGDHAAGMGNVISGNLQHGISITPRSGTFKDHAVMLLKNNLIGTTRTGMAKLPNHGHGVYLGPNGTTYSYFRLTVGDGSGSSRNVISGNAGDGVHVDPYGGFETVLEGNYVGVAADGQTALGNGDDGVDTGMENSYIGYEDLPGSRNVISANADNGVEISTVDADGPEYTNISYNRIGTDATGTLPRPNGHDGVSGSSHVVIYGNTIAANNGYGANLRDGAGGWIGANSIGVNVAGAIMGNGLGGVLLHNARDFYVSGSDTPESGNVIGGNNGHGIHLTGTSTNFTIAANFIGLTRSGAAAPNAGDGILVTAADAAAVNQQSAIGNDGGPFLEFPGNQIANNTGSGIAIRKLNALSPSPRNIRIIANGIWGNGGAGIDLGTAGPDNNDSLDADSGPNGLQNYPVITLATPSRVIGSLNSKPGTPFIIEVFKAAPDASGNGEGRYRLGHMDVTTDAFGNASFLVGGLNLTLGDQVTATATVGHYDTFVYEDQETSEFARNRTVTADVGDLAFAGAAVTTGEEKGSVMLTVVRTGGSAGTVSAAYSTTAGTAAAGSDFMTSSGTVTFAPGQTAKAIIIPLLDDTTDEAPESFSVTLSNPAGGALLLSPSTAMVTLTDNDAPPALTIGSAPAVEGSGGSSALNFTVNLSAPSALPVSVSYVTVDYTANAVLDYTAASGTLTFAPGETSKTVAIALNPDLLLETNEEFFLTLSGAVNATLPATSAKGTILDDDHPGTLQFSAATWSVSEPVEIKAITVTRTLGTAGTITVNYTITGGSATAGSDFAAGGNAGTLTFLNGQTSRTILVGLLDDSDVEGNETVLLSLSSPTGGAVLGAQTSAVLTILDDDAAPSIAGRILKSDGSPLGGATVTLSGSQSASTVSDSMGNYSFGGLIIGQNYTVTATAGGWVFAPAMRTYSGLDNSRIEQDFTGSPDVMPELHMLLGGDGSALLYWTSAATGWTLMTANTLDEEAWAPAGGAVADTPEWHTVTIPAGDARAFFRLIRNP